MPPKLFISYSWTNDPYIQKVLDLATDLVDSGVDVIIDKWDLKEGHDANAFMEKMVTDDTITKVALLCDSAYVMKANSRMGGVGAEAQIVSPELYSKAQQEKFVAVVMERDESGSPILPVYCKSRIYVDLSDAGKYTSEFEKLVRWIFGKPLFVKPAIGVPPDYITASDSSPRMATRGALRSALEALRSGKEGRIASMSEYLRLFSAGMSAFRLPQPSENYSELVISSLDEFITYRNEFIEVIWNAVLYADELESRRVVHRFFESIIPYMHSNHNLETQEFDSMRDNFKFICHELYLYAIACCIRLEKFEFGAALMDDFFIAGRSDYGKDVMVDFTCLREPIRSLVDQSRKNSRLSLRADLLHDRCSGLPVTFSDVMTADFILYLRSILHNTQYPWWPESLLYVGRFGGTFEVFARSRSQRYFDKVKIMVGVSKKDDLDVVIAAIRERKIQLPRWEFQSFSPEALLGFDQLASRP